MGERRYPQVSDAVDMAVMTAVIDREHEMVRELLQALNEYDGARPHSAQAVWYEALAKVRALAVNKNNAPTG